MLFHFLQTLRTVQCTWSIKHPGHENEVKESRDLLVDPTGVYYVIGCWRDEVVCFSKGCSLCLGVGLRKLVVFFSSGEEENDHNFILNLYTERLCKLWKSVNTDHARPCFCGTSLQLFLKVPEKVNCFSQIASCQIGSVIFQVLVDYFSSLVNSPHIVKPSF